MGYETIVWGRVKVRKSHTNEVMVEIAEARETIKGAQYSNLTEHIADTEVDETDEGLFLMPNSESQKWYAFDEYIEWLEKHIESGEIEWRGEDIDDLGGFRWINGVKYSRELEWKRV